MFLMKLKKLLLILLLTFLSRFLTAVAETVFPQCGGCQTFQYKASFTNPEIKSKIEYNNTDCTQTLSCKALNGALSTAVITAGYSISSSNYWGNAYNQIGVASDNYKENVNLKMSCRNGKWYYTNDYLYRDARVYENDNFFYCERFLYSLLSTNISITNTSNVATHCNSCPILQSGNTFYNSSRILESITEINKTECSQTLTCTTLAGPDSWIAIRSGYGRWSDGTRVVYSKMYNSSQYLLDKSTIIMRMYCRNGKWHHITDQSYIYELENNFFSCEVQQLRTTLTVPSSTPAATTSKAPTVTPTSTALTVTFNKCNEFGFNQITKNADSSTSKVGKFGGYFRNPASCGELCYLNYGLLKCHGYMHEPNNRGKCTIFLNSFNEKIVENPHSNASVFQRCTTAISAT